MQSLFTKRSLLLLPIVLLALATLVYLALLYWQWLNPSYKTAITEKGCQLESSACVARYAQTQVHFDMLGPRPFQGLENYQLSVVLSEAADAVYVDFVGLNHDMGMLRSPLSQQNGQWQGHFFLSICSSEVLEWEARVVIRRGQDYLMAAFPFESQFPLSLAEQ